MKVKNLILSLITFSFLVFSCTQEEIVPLSPNITQETMELSTMATNAPSTTTPKAYIFIEPKSKTRLIVDYLKTKPLSAPRNSAFYGFFASGRIQQSNSTDLLHYIDMPYWYNGTLPEVIQSEIPQTKATGVDNFGNPLRQYNFKTIKINKGTLNEFGWVTILIPVSGMANDTKKQTKIGYYAINGTKMVSSGNNTQTIINMNSTLYSYLLNYTGTRIPVGQYRVYSSYGDTHNRIKFNSVNDVYFRGNSN